MASKVEQAVALAQQISELKRKLKLLEKEMTLKEFIAYIDGTHPIPSNPFPKPSSSGINTPVA